MLRICTHRKSNEQGLYTCTPAASIFVCFSPEGAPPALGEQWKSCWWGRTESVSQGEAPGPGLESPIASQSQRQRSGPVQSHSRGEWRKGPEPTGNMLSNSTLYKAAQILFHLETCADTCWAGRSILKSYTYICTHKITSNEKLWLVLWHKCHNISVYSSFKHMYDYALCKLCSESLWNGHLKSQLQLSYTYQH